MLQLLIVKAGLRACSPAIFSQGGLSQADGNASTVVRSAGFSSAAVSTI